MGAFIAGGVRLHRGTAADSPADDCEAEVELEEEENEGSVE
jgi:hypothetical protein